ncbi:hypothetical protein SPBR_00784 [Sporothrix brasiliensis 5110]|uniref:Dihydrodipicolinate synthetase family protein n=1 Tax=Sporothrix brasiliensis 5110 TaxID=1398154 RepID=A0A0C2ETK7_9PEZI|nr:uncharacterized protein SPBR_00784 [Sporothrix brasiliensis 5110]KIH89844.1 hypothetical protein SPBR_00784 [Sporothrix brasiliensis 5110]
MSPTSRFSSYPPGIHGPSITFFQDTVQQEVDWETQEKHFEFMIKHLHGIVLTGSSGENATLSIEEKSQMVRKAREVATRLGKPDFPITLGVMAGCTRDILAQIEAGHQNGADFALVLVPAVFHWSMTSDAVLDFFKEVGDRSPLPIIIYNFPNLLHGIDVDPFMLEELGRHPNIYAVKLTCGSVGKATRVAAQFEPSQFTSVSGMSDWLVAALAAGSSGCISGVANIFPSVMMEIYRLYTTGHMQEAVALQKKLVMPELGIATSDVSGMKWLTAWARGYPETSVHCRRPIPRFVDQAKKDRAQGLLKPLLAVEEEYIKKAAQASASKQTNGN